MADSLFKECTLGDIAEFRNGKALSNESYSPFGKHPVFGSNGQIACTNEVLTKEPLVVVGRVGAYCGSVYHVNEPAWVTDNAIIATGKDQTDVRFLFYLLSSLELRRTAIGSAQPLMTQSGLKVVPAVAPPLAEQKAIAHILGTLDDKIELNRRMNETLETMARALFQSWFVEFDPVRAKKEGRRPGLPKPLAELFPDSFQDSVLGKIPKGWGIFTIGEKLSTILGGTPSREKAEYWTGGTVPWINSGKTNEFRIIEPSEWITNEALENSATKLLPRRTTVLAITGATLGQVSITEIECCANQSVVAVLASEQFSTEFIYPWIEENIEKLIASQTGGAQQHINKGNVEELCLLCPDRRVVTAYQTKAKLLFDKIAANCFQSRTLATLRDTLLPKLLSGELNVTEKQTVNS
ncbi:MAG: restriction endonuclease subunit S [Verrucomicrobia bacterium]|nr:restriction endonuclease subunit S [Verrucomicrobiota bacterium]